MEPIINGTDLTIDLVTLTITTPATAINGGNVPTIGPTTGTSSASKYARCRKLAPLYTKSGDNLNPYQLR
jgi:hypothetical protein